MRTRGLVATRAAYALLAVLVIIVALHVIGVGLDYAYAIQSPLEVDYGEGIVWQQTLLIPGPRMYTASQNLPFIVFHYPPVYYLLVHALSAVAPTMLAAGRSVSALATASIAVLVAVHVLLASRPGTRPMMRAGIACAAGGMVLCLHVVHLWGVMMRVDAVAVAFSLAGLAVGLARPARFPNMLAGLILCTVAVFTKQTQVSAGITLFLVGITQDIVVTLAASAITGAAGLAVVWWLQVLTAGGFLQNVIGYNINRFSLETARHILWGERSSAPAVLLMGAAVVVVLRDLQRNWKARPAGSSVLRDPVAVRRAGAIIYGLLTTLTLVTSLKSGASFNYTMEWFCAGLILIGIMLCLLAERTGIGSWRFSLTASLLIMFALSLPLRQTLGMYNAEKLKRYTALINLVSKASKPVSSENMTILMEADKSVIYEPAIVTELAELGRWDETRLVQMIRNQEFAFMLTTDNGLLSGVRRTSAVLAASHDAYPCLSKWDVDLWAHTARTADGRCLGLLQP